MKKLFILTGIISASLFNAQSYSAINDLLQKIEAKHAKMIDASGYTVNNKKFVLIEDFDDHSERHILEFNADNTLTLVELIDDKETGKSYSNIFTGDFVRKRNAISVRADLLEGKKIVRPLVYNLYIMKANDIWYLTDINSKKRWIENNNIIKKK